jgi:CRP/FNR family transcriptional regulator, cyclic AMP receptor protein
MNPRSDNISQLLAALPLFALVPPEARGRLAVLATPKRYAASQMMFCRGDVGDGMLLVLDGLVRIYLSDAKGHEVTLALIGPGEPIGEITLVDGGLRSADATALTPVSALLLRHSDVAPLIAADAKFASALLFGMAARLRRSTDQVEAISLQPLSQRLAGTLLRLSAADPSGLVRVAQGQLASLVAASRPKVNAALSEYRKLGLVVSVRAGLRLLDKDRLRALAEDV